MPKLRVHCFSVSLDGYSAGPNQDIDNPVGVGGVPVFGWQFATRTHHQMSGKDGGDTGMDDDLVARGFEGIGAWIIGTQHVWSDPRPMDGRHLGRVGGAITPPYHTPVFVLTHHPRASITMNGGTTFHFVTDGIQPRTGTSHGCCARDRMSG